MRYRHIASSKTKSLPVALCVKAGARFHVIRRVSRAPPANAIMGIHKCAVCVCAEKADRMHGGGVARVSVPQRRR
jgi:hypothetical protein